MLKLRKLLKSANTARLATYLIALWKLFKHPATPKPAKWLAIAVIAYAVSPIDLIPDFIPVLGLLDDLVLIPLGVALVSRLTPKAHWQARLLEAEAAREQLPNLWWGAALIVLLWVAVLALLVWAVAAIFGAA